MLHRDTEDVDREPADIVGPEPELHGVRKVDLNVELAAVGLGRGIRGESNHGAQ
jgi:hypothetical protein